MLLFVAGRGAGSWRRCGEGREEREGGEGFGAFESRSDEPRGVAAACVARGLVRLEHCAPRVIVLWHCTMFVVF